MSAYQRFGQMDLHRDRASDPISDRAIGLVVASAQNTLAGRTRRWLAKRTNPRHQKLAVHPDP